MPRHGGLFLSCGGRTGAGCAKSRAGPANEAGWNRPIARSKGAQSSPRSVFVPGVSASIRAVAEPTARLRPVRPVARRTTARRSSIEHAGSPAWTDLLQTRSSPCVGHLPEHRPGISRDRTYDATIRRGSILALAMKVARNAGEGRRQAEIAQQQAMPQGEVREKSRAGSDANAGAGKPRPGGRTAFSAGTGPGQSAAR